MRRQSFDYLRTVRMADTDAAGVIYFASLLSICHEAYEAFLIEAGIDLRHYLERRDLALPIVHGEIDCFKPIYYGDRLNITTTAHRVSDTSFEMNYEVRSLPTLSLILAKGMTRHVCINPTSRDRTPIPDKMCQWLT